MAIRKVSTYGVRESAKIILTECLDKGNSVGWAGNEEFLELEWLCAKFNIYMVNDFNGEFKLIEDMEKRAYYEKSLY